MGNTSYQGRNITMYSTDSANPIVLTISGGAITLDEGATSTNIALGAGASSNNFAKVVMSGGKVEYGKICLYPSNVFDYTAGGTVSIYGVA